MSSCAIGAAWTCETRSWSSATAIWACGRHFTCSSGPKLVTASYLGMFLDDPTDVPAEVVDYLAE
ncbi:DUF4158 domain-containing protein (plasmid) [Streptomyces sp. NBC_00046]